MYRYTAAEVLTLDDLALMTDVDMKEVGLPKVGGLYKSNPAVTRSLNPPGFSTTLEPYKVKNWFPKVVCIFKRVAWWRYTPGPRLRILDALKGVKGPGTGESFKCKICLDKPVQTVLKPCGHSLMCVACAQSVKQCPICRQKIEETIRWFPTW